MPQPPTIDRGQQAVDFVNSLTHTGDYNGVPFALRLWQEAFVRQLLGTIRPDGLRRYRKAFLGLPRKQGKTELAAAILLYLLLGTGKRDQQLFSASGDFKQAALIYGAAASMIRNDPALEAVCLLYDGSKRIVCERLNSFYQALSSDAPGKHGLRPSAVIFDELHVLPNRELYKALTTAFGATIEPLTLMITTAGWDRTSLCWEQWRYAEGVRDGLIDDPAFLPVIYAAQPEDDWASEDTWRKAMPGLGDFCSLEFIQDECRQAKQLPAYENSFKQLYLDLWTEQALRWLSTESWLACGGYFEPATLAGEPCYGGLDLGVTGDMSVYALAFPDGSGGYAVLAHGWAPREGKWRKEPRNKDRYEDWARLGYLTLTDGDTTDHQQIEDAIVKWADVYPLRTLYADRAYATQILTRLANTHGIEVKGIPQGPVTLNEAMVRLEELVISQTIRHGDNPLLNWAVANAVIHLNTTGLKHLDKSQATERIDALAALVNALAAAVADPNNTGPSIYESRGVATA